ncbi:MAG: SsrA-binding protein SmpB [Hyphomonadaceae bacterium]|nr:SsrA-binding protein SmpB [Hyphomonadaceae bacterium]MBC6412414.1 SsrA-binding protein SmpB [Hyphomonadaceae bacterium]
MPANRESQGRVIAENRRAHHDYTIEETFEAGIQLFGTEVKALREGRANIAESYGTVKGTEVYLVNADIPVYAPANRFNHAPARRRKLLLKRRQINKLAGETQRKGRTIVPLKLYFNNRGLIKLLIGIGVGKRNVDKRETQRKRDWQKQKARLLRARGQ